MAIGSGATSASATPSDGTTNIGNEVKRKKYMTRTKQNSLISSLKVDMRVLVEEVSNDLQSQFPVTETECCLVAALLPTIVLYRRDTYISNYFVLRGPNPY